MLEERTEEVQRLQAEIKKLKEDYDNACRDSKILNERIDSHVCDLGELDILKARLASLEAELEETLMKKVNAEVSASYYPFWSRRLNP